MTKRAAFKQIEITRAIKGAMRAGLPVGSFELRVENGAIRVLPVAANEPFDEAADLERRMKDAFGR